MPRAHRVVVPDMALHIRQRGHNRTACFFRQEDYATYLDYLFYFAREQGCAVHSYCLMTNHVHLLVTPRDEQGCVLMMKQLGQCYTQHVNKALERTGSLWEGRYRSCPVGAEAYVLACYRYIELNPVAAGMVQHPREYRWSSYRSNAEGEPDPMITPHPAYQGPSDYRSLFDSELEPALVRAIRKATNGGYLVGTMRRPRGRQMRKMGSDPI